MIYIGTLNHLVTIIYRYSKSLSYHYISSYMHYQYLILIINQYTTYIFTQLHNYGSKYDSFFIRCYLDGSRRGYDRGPCRLQKWIDPSPPIQFLRWGWGVLRLLLSMNVLLYFYYRPFYNYWYHENNRDIQSCPSTSIIY